MGWHDIQFRMSTKMIEGLKISRLPGLLTVCKLYRDAPIPDWAQDSGFLALIRTPDEFTVVCPQANVPDGVIAEPGWVALKVHGPLEFDLVGILAALSSTLAEAGVSIYTISTYETDYIMLKETMLEIAYSALLEAGHKVLKG